MGLSKRRRNLVLVLASFIVGLLYFVPYIRYSFYDQTMAAFQLTNKQFGDLASVYGILALFGYPISGILSQKFGSRIMLTASLVGSAIATFWQAQFPSYAALLIIHILFAIFTTATLWSPYLSLVRKLGTEKEQGRLFGISEAMRGIVSTIVGFTFIWVLSLFASGVDGLKAVLIIVAILEIILAVVGYIFIPKEEELESREVNATNEAALKKFNLVDAIKTPGVWLVGIFIFFCYTIITTCSGYLGPYTTQVLNVTPAVASALAIVRSYVVTIVAGVLGGVLADRFKKRSIFLVYILSGIAICLALLPFLSNVAILAIIVTLVLGFFNLTVKSTYYSILGEAGIPVAMTGIATGVISFIGYVPDAFVTTMMGSWLDVDPINGFNKIFLTLTVSAIGAIIVGFIIYKYGKKMDATKDMTL